MKKYVAEILYGSLLLLFFLGYSRQFSFPLFPGYFMLQMVAPLLLIAFIHFWLRREWGWPRRTLGYVVLYFGWTILTTLWAKKLWIVPETLQRNLLIFFLVLGLTFVFSRCEGLRENMGKGTLAVLALVAFLYWCTLLSYDFELEGRFRFPFANPNLAGSILGFAALLTAGYCLMGKKKRILVCVPVLALFWILLVFSHCKGASLAALVATAFLVLWRFPKLRLAGLLAGSAFLVFIFLRWDWIFSQISASFEVRASVWKVGIIMAGSDPWRLVFGWGSGNFFAHFPDFQDPSIFAGEYAAEIIEGAHNFYLETLVEYGLVGLLLFLLLTFKILQLAYRLYRDSVQAQEKETAFLLAGALLMILLDAFTSIAFSYVHGQILWAISLAWLSGQRLESYPRPSSHPISLPGKILLMLLLLSTLFFWKEASLRFGAFYHGFQKALRASPEKQYDAMTQIPEPPWENLYTLEWRLHLGAAFLDHPQREKAIVIRNRFLRIEKYMPEFGLFHLYKAVLYAQEGQTEKAEKTLFLSAERNPFSLDLWIWWSILAKSEKLDPTTMLAVARFYQAHFPENKIPVLGEALALHLLGNPKEAARLMKEVQHWAQKYFKQYGKRKTMIIEFTGQYLDRQKQGK